MPTVNRNADGGIVTSEDTLDGTVIYGPYIHAAPVRYRVYHKMKVLSSSGPSELSLDVCLDAGESTVRKTVKEAEGELLSTSIEFDHAKGGKLEFRVMKTGNLILEHLGADLIKI
jgi:hypothetical protein